MKKTKDKITITMNKMWCNSKVRVLKKRIKRMLRKNKSKRRENSKKN